MRYVVLAGLLTCFVSMSSSVWSQDTTVIRHYQAQTRYAFGIRLLELALEKSNLNYDIQTPYGNSPQVVNEGRGEYLVIKGDLDLEFMSTTAQRELLMIPIKIPIYRGILGMRLILIKPTTTQAFNSVNSIDTLRGFTAGHGVHWGDLPVYEANELRVVTSTNYESLFKMLIAGRFHYFHRGMNEIWEELDRYSEDLVIADDVALFYPLPVYFFVSKHRPELALKIKEGLEVAIEDGSYKKLFLKYYSDIIARSNLDQRTVITLSNPVIPGNTPEIDTSWWLPYREEQ